MSGRPVKIAILADPRDAVAGFRQTGAAAQDAGNKIEQGSTRAQKAGKAINLAAKASAVGLLAAGAGALKLADGAAEDEKAAKALAGALKNTAKATDAQVASTEDWITAQGKALGVADDDLRPALTKLSNATHDVRKAQELTSLAMDISAGSGKSLESVTAALAKAQLGNVAGLSKLGIKTKESVKDEAALQAANIAVAKAQEKYNAALAAHGPKSAEAQAAAADLELRQTKLGAAQGKMKTSTITADEAMARLAKTYKGQASGAADTLEGKMGRAKLALAESGESIGYMLIPALTKLADWLNTKVMPALESVISWMDSHQTTVKILAIVIGAIAGAFIAASLAMKAYTAVSTVMAVAQGALNAVMAANPIMLVVLALAALVAGFVIAYKKSETFRNIVNGALNAVKTAASNTLGWLRRNWPLILAILTGPFGLIVLTITKKWDAITDGAKKMWNYISSIPGKIKGAFSGIWDGLGDGLKGALNRILHLPLTIPKVNTHIPGVGTVGGQTLIPALANGGIVNRPTLALIGEAGPEAVVPLSRGKGFGGGNTYAITVQVPVSASPVDTGREIVSAIDAYERAGGRRRAS